MAGIPVRRAVGEGANTPPPTAERIGTGALTSVVVVRRFRGIPKVAAFRRISAPGDRARFPKVAGEPGPAALANTTGDLCAGDICTDDCTTVPGQLGRRIPGECCITAVLVPVTTALTPGKMPGLADRGALERIIVVGLDDARLPVGIPNAFMPWMAGVAGDHGEPQGEPHVYVEHPHGERSTGEPGS